MDAMDETEANAKNDSAYSTSCSNSQSRSRSHSSKSGSHSSGSSGYGGKSTRAATITVSPVSKEKTLPSTGGQVKAPPDNPAEYKKESKAPKPPEPSAPIEVKLDVILPPPAPPLNDVIIVNACKPTTSAAAKLEMEACNALKANVIICNTTHHAFAPIADGFSCVISMQEGVVLYATPTMATILGYPKEMLIGRSFIDFVHRKDRDSFASNIMKSVDTPRDAPGPSGTSNNLTMCCRLRLYRGLTVGYGVRNGPLLYKPFFLAFSFKDIMHGETKTVYLVVEATPFASAFKVPNERVTNMTPFTTRHMACGKIDMADITSVPYLGYLPQDVAESDALDFYHQDDLGYILQLYVKVIREGSMKSQGYRMKVQNGEYMTVQTEFSCHMNPWTKKLEFIGGKHTVIEGPFNPDVFGCPLIPKPMKRNDEYKSWITSLRNSIKRAMVEVPKAVEAAKKMGSNRCMEITAYTESFGDEQPKEDKTDAASVTQEPEQESCSYYERDSTLLGGISPHYDNESKSGSESPISYTQLNYNENLQRYFDSYEPFNYEELSGEYGLDDDDRGSFPYTRSKPEMRGVDMLLEECLNRKLTQKLLLRHNSDMENDLALKHRAHTSLSRVTREDILRENRRRNLKHIASCNATYQLTPASSSSNRRHQQLTKTCTHGLKRPSHHERDACTVKHRCAVKKNRPRSTSDVPPPNYLYTHTPDIMPMFYLPSNKPGMPVTVGKCMVAMPPAPAPGAAQPRIPVPYVMSYASSSNGPSLMYSPIGPEVASPGLQAWMDSSVHHQQIPRPLGLNTSEEVRKPCVKIDNSSDSLDEWLNSTRMTRRDYAPHYQRRRRSPIRNMFSSAGGSNRASKPLREVDSSMDLVNIWLNSTRHFSNRYRRRHQRANHKFISSSSSSNRVSPTRKFSPMRRGIGENRSAEKTDGESSYSSFCSSFFKTDTSSTEESDFLKMPMSGKKCEKYYGFCDYPERKMLKKKQPPWMEKVILTPDLVYRYQMVTKRLEDVLEADKQAMSHLEQPSLVNEQLSQLYVDMQLAGGPARLILEEGITSSGSSGEENVVTVIQQTKKYLTSRRKREYSRLVMIYEEDAPLPPPPRGNDLPAHDVAAPSCVSSC